MTTQTKTANAINDQVTKQMDQMINLASKGYAQAEKTMDFWMTQTQEAIKESQKLSKEWMSTGKAMSDEFVKACQTQVKEATKLFTPAA
ncbi:MAG TPA: hypothetical protein VK997_12275 [Deferrisomatales bacterium]|nr:hypothetical protein [Deferrisomatales bacterium]